MQKNFGQGDALIAEYAEQTFFKTDNQLAEIRRYSTQMKLPQIHVGDMDGLHLEVLTRALKPKKIVEIGTLAGFSGVCLMRGMDSNEGHLYTFEADQHHAKVARHSFDSAGFQNRYQIFVGKALSQLPQIENHGPFDLVFIDADKANYLNYLNWAADHLRVGGVVLADNTFAWGLIAQNPTDSEENNQAVKALREFNHAIANSDRFRATILPTGEGLTMGVKIK